MTNNLPPETADGDPVPRLLPEDVDTGDYVSEDPEYGAGEVEAITGHPGYDPAAEVN